MNLLINAIIKQPVTRGILSQALAAGMQLILTENNKALVALATGALLFVESKDEVNF